MAMSNRDLAAMEEIIDFWTKPEEEGGQGFATYAKLLRNYHLNLTADPNVLAYMEPSSGRIVVNEDLSIEEVSVALRHEIMHFYLDHTERLYKKLIAEQRPGFTKETLDNASLEDITSQVFTDISNIAMDYEISNLTYDDDDKIIIRGMNALVTEDQHADWVDLTMEEMYDKLLEEEAKKPIYGVLNPLTKAEFIDTHGDIWVFD